MTHIELENSLLHDGIGLNLRQTSEPCMIIYIEKKENFGR